MTAKNSNKLNKSDLRQVFFRSFPLEWSFNYLKQQNIGFANAVIPALNKIYTKKEDRIEAYKRNLEFFNITPWMSTFVMGLTLAMEEKNTEEEEFDTTTINNVKVSLMGPLSGIGDSFFWGTLRILATGIGTSLALQGNIFGALVYLLIFNIPAMFIRYQGTMLGYRLGDTFLDKVLSSGLMDKLTHGASIVGLMVIGGMASTFVSVNMPMTIGTAEDAQTISEIFNSIFPNLLSLIAVGIVYYLVKKDYKPQTIILVIATTGILGAFLGVLG